MFTHVATAMVTCIVGLDIPAGLCRGKTPARAICSLCSYYSLFAKPTKPAEPHPPREYEEIRFILEPFWHVFNLVLEYEPRPCVYNLITPPTEPAKPFIITEIEALSPDGKLIQAYGPSVHAPWISSAVRTASNKFNHCDFSIYLFLCYLEPLLSRVGATITWLAVEAKPHWVIHWEGGLPDPLVRHSVFSITTRSDEEYIADFTIEQFGFERDCWLMRKSDYEKLCTTGNKRQQPSAKEIEGARQGEIKDWYRKACVVRGVCNTMQEYVWRPMDKMARVLWLEGLVKEACWDTWRSHEGYRFFQ